MWCEYEREQCKDINTNAIQILLDEIKLSKTSPWLIYASSREVYGAVNEFPITEETPMNPLNLYGRTKMESENIISSSNNTLQSIILRFSSIYGGRYDHTDRLIPSMVRSMLMDQPILFTGGNQEFDFTHVDDVVEAILLSIQHVNSNSPFETKNVKKFNICSGELTSITKLYYILKELTNSNSPPILLDNNSVFPDRYEASTQLSQHVLGFKSKYSIRQGLIKYLEQIYNESKSQIVIKLKQSLSIDEIQTMKQLHNCSVVFENNNQLHPVSAKHRVSTYFNQTFLQIPSLDNNNQFYLKINSHSRSMVLLNSKQPNQYYDLDKKTFQMWDNTTYPLKIHVHCCPSMNNHPLAQYSPYFISNYKSRMLNTNYNTKLQDSILYYTKQLVKLDSLKKKENDSMINIWSMFKIMSNPNNNPSLYQQSKIYCESDCNNIIPCIKSENCNCHINEHCSHQSMTLPSFISNSPNYNKKNNLLSIYGRSLGKKWPKVYVHEFPESSPYLNSKDCVELQKEHCFSMDYVIYNSFKNISVSIEEAEIVLLPFFHGCARHYRQQDVGALVDGYVLRKFTEFRNKYPDKLFVTMASHDFGGCANFWMTYFEMGEEPSQKRGFASMMTLQPNGDYFSKCYASQKDIVAPPRTCLTNQLISTFSNVASVKPILKRKHLVFFEGSLFGTGESTRATLKECNNIFGYKPKNEYSTYIEMLGDTKFCPLITGTTGWATRNSDVIYSGCIPVIVSEYTHQPFSTLLDYSKFSIKIHPSDVYNLNLILQNISEEKMIELQENLMLVRDLMIYKNVGTVEEWSPQDMILRELYIKTKTIYLK